MIWILSVCQRAHVLNALVTSAMFRSGAVGKWLDHESSGLINRLIHWWINNLMSYWKVMEI
jgi:hypothetical protein